MFFKYLFLVFSCLILFSNSHQNPWDLPVIPTDLAIRKAAFPLYNETVSQDRLIPRHLWIAVRDISDGLNYQMPGLFQRNPKYNIHIVSNDEKDFFMNTTFANTSVLWAYHSIHPEAGAAKADIWRYAVLYTYGGVYIDDDSDMKTPLDKIIEPLDSLIVAYENNGFSGDVCYIPKFHLSDFHMNKHKHIQPPELDRNLTYKKQLFGNIFHGRVLLNWAIFSAPRHLVIHKTLTSVVEVIHHEYIRDSVLRHLKGAYRWQLVMCATGPSVLTASARELVIDNSSDFTYKLAGKDFGNYGGKFKAVTIKVANDPNHYMNMHKKKHMTLLRHYATPAGAVGEGDSNHRLWLSWDRQAVQAQNGKQIYVMDSGKKRGINNWESFLALNFTMADVRVIADERLDEIPTGEDMPLLSLANDKKAMLEET